MFADQKKGKSTGDGYALQNKIASGNSIFECTKGQKREFKFTRDH